MRGQVDNKENLMEVEMEKFRQNGKRVVLQDLDQNIMSGTAAKKEKEKE